MKLTCDLSDTYAAITGYLDRTCKGEIPALSFPPPTKAFEGRLRRESMLYAIWQEVMGSCLRGNDSTGHEPCNFQANLIFIAVFMGVMPATWACNPELEGSKGTNPKSIESKNYAMRFRTQPEKIAVGQHFAVELALCAKEGAAAPAIDNVRVDAHMPEHRHGMNYKTIVTASGAGRYRAEGLMFHMPGRWEYIFEVRAAGATERLTTSVVLP